MTRAAKLVAVLILTGGCAFPSAAQQPTTHKTQKSTKTAKASAAAPAYPYMEAIHQNDLGVDLMDQAQFGDAYAKFQMACIMDVESDVGCQNAGIALLYLKHYEDARQMLAKSAERNPQYARAWFNLGVLEHLNGNPDAAIADFEKAAAIDPADADTQCLLGLLYLDQKQYTNATVTLTKASELDPLLASAELGLAQATQQSGAIGQSLKHLGRLQEMTANNTGRTVDFAYGKGGKFSKAEKIVPPGTQATAATPAP